MHAGNKDTPKPSDSECFSAHRRLCNLSFKHAYSLQEIIASVTQSGSDDWRSNQDTGGEEVRESKDSDM